MASPSQSTIPGASSKKSASLKIENSIHSLLPGAARPALAKKPSSFASYSVKRTTSSKNDQRPGIHGTTTAFPIDKSTNLNRAISYPVDEWPEDTSSLSSSSSEDEGETGRAKRRDSERKKMPGLREPQTIDPASDKSHSAFAIGNEKYQTSGRVSRRDGRLRLTINEFSKEGYLTKTLGAGFKQHLLPDEQEGEPPAKFYQDEIKSFEQKLSRPLDYKSMTAPKLNIVIIVIGSRGDIQPFVKIGKILQEQYGHRVRLATHPAFKDFIEKENKLEFFSVGGNPSELMAFMVKNPGLIPTMETVTSGEVGRRRAAMYEMFLGMWQACISTTDEAIDMPNVKNAAEKRPFVADAIIANPPSFAHVHLAERLGIPLHLMFTFPYSPTSYVPHPLAHIKPGNVDNEYTNFMSYPLVDMMTWQGLGDLVNLFRVETLGLDHISTLWAPGQLYRMKVPYSYLWSPGLFPKPADWGPEIDVCGYVFLDLASAFKPPDDLATFLEAGPPPVYIGFGSIVVDDPDAFTKLIFKAIEISGVRALVSKGWGGLGGEMDIPENVFMLGNTPHDWLFPKVSAVVHHGGAGTTAIGLKCGRPTMIVPFFGDQEFWGAMVADAKAGARQCVPYKHLTAARLAEGIKECLLDESKENAAKIAESIVQEGDGAENAVKSFLSKLPIEGRHSLRCSVLENKVAAWYLKACPIIHLSPIAAEFLVGKKKLKYNELRLLRHYDWANFGGPGEPVTAVGGALVNITTKFAKGVKFLPWRNLTQLAQTDDHLAKAEARKSSVDGKKSLDEREQTTHNGEKDKPDISGQHVRRPKTNSGRAHNMDKEEVKVDTQRGLMKTGAAVAKAPVDIAMALAQGFHNAPRLYGDDTVRKPVRITGCHSGLKAAWSEFIYEISDALTGIYKHPIHDYQVLGAVGLITGPGKAIGGIVLKTTAGIIGPIAFTLKGLESELHKSKTPIAHIRRTRMAQGSMEKAELDEAHRNAVQKVVLDRWSAEYKKWKRSHEAELQRHQKRKKALRLANKLDTTNRTDKTDGVDNTDRVDKTDVADNTNRVDKTDVADRADEEKEQPQQQPGTNGVAA